MFAAEIAVSAAFSTNPQDRESDPALGSGLDLQHDFDCRLGPGKRGYMINVASAKNGVGYGAWTHIDGFSENVIRFIQEIEGESND